MRNEIVIKRFLRLNFEYTPFPHLNLIALSILTHYCSQTLYDYIEDKLIRQLFFSSIISLLIASSFL